MLQACYVKSTQATAGTVRDLIKRSTVCTAITFRDITYIPKYAFHEGLYATPEAEPSNVDAISDCLLQGHSGEILSFRPHISCI